MPLNQGLSNGGEPSNLGAKTRKAAKGGHFKICRDKLILDILKLQMKSKKKVLGNGFYFKLSKGTIKKKRVWETML